MIELVIDPASAGDPTSFYASTLEGAYRLFASYIEITGSEATIQSIQGKEEGAVPAPAAVQTDLQEVVLAALRTGLYRGVANVGNPYGFNTYAEDAGGTHLLKTWPEYFAEVAGGMKSFEVRKDDRDFKVGDVLYLMEYDPGVPDAPDATPDEASTAEAQRYTGRGCRVEVIYLLKGGQFGIEEGYCVMGLSPPLPVRFIDPPTG